MLSVEKTEERHKKMANARNRNKEAEESGKRIGMRSEKQDRTQP